MFRTLTEKEKEEFSKYAKDNSYELIVECIKHDTIFHPVVKDVLLEEIKIRYNKYEGKDS